MGESLLGSLGRHMWGFEEVKGIRAGLHTTPPFSRRLFHSKGDWSGLLGPLFQNASDCKFCATWRKSLTLPGP